MQKFDDHRKARFGKHKFNDEYAKFFNEDNTYSKIKERKGKLMGYKIDDKLKLILENEKPQVVFGNKETYEIIGFRNGHARN